MSPANCKLAVRPRPTPGESLPGYLMRVANANGFASVRQLHSFLHDQGRGAFHELCERLGLAADERGRLFGVLPKQWAGMEPPLDLAPMDFNQTCRRWCPLCVREGGFLQGLWTLKLSCVCVHHGVWLHDQCPRCGEVCGWVGTQQTRCGCHVLLSEGVPELAELPNLLICQQLCGASSVDQDATAWSGLSPASFHRLVRYLGGFATAVRPAHPGQTANLHRLPVARALVAGTAHLLQDWPENLHRLMRVLQPTAPQSFSVRRTFAPLYRVLYDDLSDANFQFLRDAFEGYLHQHWWGLVCRRNKRMGEVTQTAHPRLTIPQAAKEANAPTSVVRHLVQASLISEVSTPLPSGRRSRTIHVNDVPLLKEATAGAVTLTQAARTLALPERRLRDLIKANALAPLISKLQNPKAGAWLIPASEVNRFHVMPSHASMSSTQLKEVRKVLKYWRLREDVAVALVQAVAARELRAKTHAKSCTPIPIGLASVEASEVKQWLAAYRARSSENDMSVDQAAKALGVKQQVAYDLVHAGLLIAAPGEDSVGSRVTNEGLSAFKAAYVSLSDLARDAQRSPRALLAEINVAPVCGPSLGSCRQYFFRRTEVLQSFITPKAALSFPA